ncbi:MAG: peptidylprolyl isomerase [Chlamydiales bacterium]|nr:peptidylprolyl isomerase [Chlamydiales bacterium]
MRKYFLLVVTALLSLFCGKIFSKEITAAESNHPKVLIETNQGIIEVVLWPDVAPRAVENFLKHAEDGYYNNTIFHRVIRNFMIQGGDPLGNGTGGESIWGRPFENEIVRGVKFDKVGLLAMANKGPGTNGSQFFITTAPTLWLNGKHTIFGEVVKGYDVVEDIEGVPADSKNRPFEPQKIIKMVVEG